MDEEGKKRRSDGAGNEEEFDLEESRGIDSEEEAAAEEELANRELRGCGLLETLQAVRKFIGGLDYDCDDCMNHFYEAIKAIPYYPSSYREEFHDTLQTYTRALNATNDPLNHKMEDAREQINSKLSRMVVVLIPRIKERESLLISVRGSVS